MHTQVCARTHSDARRYAPAREGDRRRSAPFARFETRKEGCSATGARDSGGRQGSGTGRLPCLLGATLWARSQRLRSSKGLPQALDFFISAIRNYATRDHSPRRGPESYADGLSPPGRPFPHPEGSLRLYGALSTSPPPSRSFGSSLRCRHSTSPWRSAGVITICVSGHLTLSCSPNFTDVAARQARPPFSPITSQAMARHDEGGRAAAALDDVEKSLIQWGWRDRCGLAAGLVGGYSSGLSSSESDRSAVPLTKVPFWGRV